MKIGLEETNNFNMEERIYSITMTEDELRLFSEFLEEREYSSKAQKLRRRAADIKRAEQQWQNMGVISGPLDSQYHNNALKFGRTLNKSSQGESGINKVINNKDVYSINERKELLSSGRKKINKNPINSNATKIIEDSASNISGTGNIVKSTASLDRVSKSPVLTGKVTKLRKLAKVKKVGKVAGIGAGIAGATALGTVAYKKIKNKDKNEENN